MNSEVQPNLGTFLQTKFVGLWETSNPRVSALSGFPKVRKHADLLSRGSRKCENTRICSLGAPESVKTCGFAGDPMFLIVAEAQAMMGNPTAAAATLNSFVATYRDPAYNCTATTAEEAQNAVWMQRRIELWGEGFSYFDLMRMKKGVDRRGAGFQEEYVYNIPNGDAALIYQIPSTEMNNNPALIQNPEATQPTPVTE